MQDTGLSAIAVPAAPRAAVARPVYAAAPKRAGFGASVTGMAAVLKIAL